MYITIIIMYYYLLLSDFYFPLSFLYFKFVQTCKKRAIETTDITKSFGWDSSEGLKF